MFQVKHYLFISVFIINNISFFLLYNYFPGNISMFHVEHYLFISVLLSTTSFSFYFNIISWEIFLCFTWNIIYLSPFLLSTTSLSFYFVIISWEIFLCFTWNIIYLSPFYYQLHLFLFTLILFPGKYFYVSRGTLSIYLRFIINNISFFLLYNYFPGNNFIYKETFIKYFHNSFVLYETFFI